MATQARDYTEFDKRMLVLIAAGPRTAADLTTALDADAKPFPAIGHQGTVEPKRGQKVQCRTCKTIWANTMALKLRVFDFI